MTYLFNNVSVDISSSLSYVNNCTEAFENELSRVGKVIYSVCKKQLAEVKGLAHHAKIGALWVKYCELYEAVPVGLEKFALSVKGLSAHLGGLAALGAALDTSERVLAKISGIEDKSGLELLEATVSAVYNKIFGVKKRPYDTVVVVKNPGLLDLQNTEDQIARVLSIVGLVCYVHSRVFLAANYLENTLHVPVLKGVSDLIADRTMKGLMLGGVSQVAIAGVRIVSAGSSFQKEGSSALSETANKVNDWLLLGEGLCMVAEAGVIMFGVANPGVLLACQATGLGFKLAQVWVVPLVKEYFPKTEK